MVNKESDPMKETMSNSTPTTKGHSNSELRLNTTSMSSDKMIELSPEQSEILSQMWDWKEECSEELNNYVLGEPFLTK